MIGQKFDLALTKTINTTVTSGPYGPGSAVSFDVTVYNQGTLDAYDIDVSEYVPSGLTYVNMTVPATSTNGNAVSTIGTGPSYELEYVAAGDGQVGWG